MREDLPSRELQDLRPALGDGRVPIGWARSINRACTAWLLKRGLLGPPVQHHLVLLPTAHPEDDEEERIEPARIEIAGFSFRRRRFRPGAAARPPTASEARTNDHETGVLREEKG